MENCTKVRTDVAESTHRDQSWRQRSGRCTVEAGCRCRRHASRPPRPFCFSSRLAFVSPVLSSTSLLTDVRCMYPLIVPVGLRLHAMFGACCEQLCGQILSLRGEQGRALARERDCCQAHAIQSLLIVSFSSYDEQQCSCQAAVRVPQLGLRTGTS